MKQFFFAVALTFALAAGCVTMLTAQLTRAAAQTFAFGVGTLTADCSAAGRCSLRERQWLLTHAPTTTRGI